jgi:hypothetical protein
MSGRLASKSAPAAVAAGIGEWVLVIVKRLSGVVLVQISGRVGDVLLPLSFQIQS